MSIDLRAKQYGRVFGDWRIRELIGQGSGGKTAVFRLTRNNFTYEEVCAMKVINIIEQNGKYLDLSENYKNAYEQERVSLCNQAEREVRLMYELRGSGNIVNYLDYRFEKWDDEEGFGTDLLIRMDLLSNLGEQLAKGAEYSEDQIIEVGKDICTALIACHKANIIHRDIKPANIFISQYGNYLLGDFGISKMLEEFQNAATMTGTKAYAAPEQFDCNGEYSYDYRVDIYSLGLAMYEMANSNCLPFEKTNYVHNENVLLRITGKELPKPQKVSDELAEVILKACAFNKGDRYQTAEAFKKVLEDLGSSGEKTDNAVVKTVKRKSVEVDASAYETQAALEVPEVEVDTSAYETQAALEVPEVEVDASAYETQAALEVPEVEVDASAYETQAALEVSEVEVTEIEEVIKETVEEVEEEVEEEPKNKLDIDYVRVGKEYYNKGDYVKAAEWYAKSAHQGQKKGQYELAYCYYNGLGVSQDINEAIKWYENSAKQGYVESQLALGDIYYQGNVVVEDYQKAADWYERSAENGSAAGQYGLGNCYYYGKGVVQDYKQAVVWYTKSAKQGNVGARTQLSDCYFYGYGVKKDKKKAKQLMEG